MQSLSRNEPLSGYLKLSKWHISFIFKTMFIQSLMSLSLILLAKLALAGPLITSVDIPIELKGFSFNTGMAEIFVPCSFENHQRTCKVDTGSPFSKAHGLDFTQKPLANVSVLSITGQKIKCSYVALNSVSVGTETAGGTTVDIAKETHHKVLSCPENIRSTPLLGLNFFANKTFTLNSKESILRVHANSLLTDQAQAYISHETPLFQGTSAFHMILPFEVGQENASVSGIFDTGSPMTVVAQDLARNRPDLFTKVTPNPLTAGAQDGHGNAIENEVYKITSANFQGHKIIDEYVMAMDFTSIRTTHKDIHFILGMNWIRHFKWTFDDQQKLFLVEEP